MIEQEKLQIIAQLNARFPRYFADVVEAFEELDYDESAAALDRAAFELYRALMSGHVAFGGEDEALYVRGFQLLRAVSARAADHPEAMGHSCNFAGLMHGEFSVPGVAIDRNKALDFYQKGAKLGDKLASLNADSLQRIF